MLTIRSSHLGELEIAVLEHLWAEGALDAKGAHKVMGSQRGIALHTVQSAMERLYRKKLLRREKVRHAYIYTPAVQREELLTRLLGQVINVFEYKSPDLLAAFVDLAARADVHSLDRLERLITERRRQEREKNP